jgi:vacuolar-type H+-ATPase subunit I/STV1
MLFVHLPTPAMAGNMAAKLFSAQTWVAMACGLFLLIHSQGNSAHPPTGRAREAIFFVVSGMMLALLSEFAVAPKIVARENLAVWHGIGTLTYALQWSCSAISFWKLMAPADSSQV